MDDSENQCAIFEIRSNYDDFGSIEGFRKWAKGIVKKYTIQLEEGDGGYKHWQGRISIIKKRRLGEFKKFITTSGRILPNYIKPTTNAALLQGEAFYLLKEDTRIDGPWTEKDEPQEQYIPRQYRGIIDKLTPFQKAIFDSGNEFDTRQINLIVDTNGNRGKSTISVLCELFGHGIDMPPVNDAEKMIQTICDICEARNMRSPSPVCIDLPRAMNKEKLNGLYTAIEQIKKGKLYDFRYKYKQWWIDSPQIWVFSNFAPDFMLLSSDRWKVWQINDKNELEKYKIVELINL